MQGRVATVITESVRQKRLAVAVDCHSKTEFDRQSPVMSMLCNNGKYPSAQRSTYANKQNGKCPSKKAAVDNTTTALTII